MRFLAWIGGSSIEVNLVTKHINLEMVKLHDFTVYLLLFVALNRKWCFPCCLLSVWFSSTSWFKDSARWCPRLLSHLDFWASTATWQLLTSSYFAGNILVRICPSKFVWPSLTIAHVVFSPWKDFGPCCITFEHTNATFPDVLVFILRS